MSANLKLPASLRLLRKLNFPKKLGILEKLYGLGLSKHGVSWVECCNGVTWKLDLSDPCHRWIVYGKYEGGKGIDFARKQLRNGGYFLDSGSNIGQWLLYLGDIDNLTSLAFEPVTSQYNWLQECLEKQNNWSVKVFKFGLGETKSLKEIQCNAARSTLNLDWFLDKKLERETIEINRLDQVLYDLNVEHIEFWKLDVEGAEFQVLKGAEKFLKNKRIKTIYFECHPENFINVVSLFNSHSYNIYKLQKSALVSVTDTLITSTQDFVAITD